MIGEIVQGWLDYYGIDLDSIDGEEAEEAYEVFGEATARIPSLDPNQSCHEPECVMSITPCDENGMDLP